MNAFYRKILKCVETFFTDSAFLLWDGAVLFDGAAP